MGELAAAALVLLEREGLAGCLAAHRADRAVVRAVAALVADVTDAQGVALEAALERVGGGLRGRAG